MPNTSIILVMTTFSNSTEAESVSSSLINQKLAACVNLLPSVTSMYQWQGKLQKESEVIAIFKTTEEEHEAFVKALQNAHSYEVPEIMSFSPTSINAIYSEWLQRCLQATPA